MALCPSYKFRRTWGYRANYISYDEITCCWNRCSEIDPVTGYYYDLQQNWHATFRNINEAIIELKKTIHREIINIDAEQERIIKLFGPKMRKLLQLMEDVLNVGYISGDSIKGFSSSSDPIR